MIFDGGREKTHNNCNAYLQILPLSHLRCQILPVGSVGAFALPRFGAVVITAWSGFAVRQKCELVLARVAPW